MHDWAPLVAAIEGELIQEGRSWNTYDEYEADIANAARERIGKLAAQWMGRQGGKASQQARVVPGGGVTGASVSTGPDANRYRVGWGDPEG